MIDSYFYVKDTYLFIRYLIVRLKSDEENKIKVISLSKEFIPKKHTFLEVIPISLNVF